MRKGLLAQWHHWDNNEMVIHFSEAILWYKKILYHDGLGHAFYGMGRAARGLGTVVFNPASYAEEAWKAFEQSALHFRKADNLVMLAELYDWFSYVYVNVY